MFKSIFAILCGLVFCSVGCVGEINTPIEQLDLKVLRENENAEIVSGDELTTEIISDTEIISGDEIVSGDEITDTEITEITEPEITDTEIISTEPEILDTGFITISKLEHCQIFTDKSGGNVGDTIIITVKPSLFYKIESVSVNGQNLIESEKISGQFEFKLVKGENIISAKMVVDNETLGEFATIYEQISNGDWRNVFSVSNILTIVSWLFTSGILVALVRYYIKDKKLAEKLENRVKNSVETIIPETTKETVLATMKELLVPTFEKLTEQMANVSVVSSTLAKCMALMQENSPESRIAILNALDQIKGTDIDTINTVKNSINDMLDRAQVVYDNIISSLNKISETNKEIINQEPVAKIETSKPNNPVD